MNKHSKEIFSLIKGAYQGLESNTTVMFYPSWDSDRELKRGFGFSQTDGHTLASQYAEEDGYEHYVFYTMQDADSCREFGTMYFCFSDITAANLLIDQLNWGIFYTKAPYTIDWNGSEETRIKLRPLEKGEERKVGVPSWVPEGA